jgi:hypothetical protein
MTRCVSVTVCPDFRTPSEIVTQIFEITCCDFKFGCPTYKELRATYIFLSKMVFGRFPSFLNPQISGFLRTTALRGLVFHLFDGLKTVSEDERLLKQLSLDGAIH